MVTSREQTEKQIIQLMMIDKIDQSPRLNLRQLEVFVATAHAGSTWAAAGRIASIAEQPADDYPAPSDQWEPIKR